MIAVLILACRPDPVGPPELPPRPSLIVRPDQRGTILGRLDREPWASILAELQADAARELYEPDPEAWDHKAHGENGEIAQAAAMLAWLLDDPDQADKAREAFALLTDDFETNTTWDVNIRMPHSLMGYTTAHDLLLGTPWLPEDEAAALEEKLTTITGKFFAAYVQDDLMRGIALGPSQNNHPIRTAAAIGYVAMAFPDHPDAEEWADWAFSELDYLWGPTGRYVQPDGGVSEGPFYYGFAYGPSVAFAIAASHVVPPDRTFHRDCINRQDVDPWTGHGCVDGEPFTWPELIPRLVPTIDWSIALRLPDGSRPPLGDAYLNPLNGGALLTSFTGEGHTRWDWESHVQRPMEMHHGLDLVPHHLVWVDDVEPVEPPWRNRFLPDAGNAVFRSGWDSDARWGLLVAEAGSARKTLHDHVDGTSFQVAAYGEYLLIDPGYHKPNELDNAVTAHSPSHNVVLVEGRGAPNKGLLTNFGDADAFLEHTLDGDAVAYAEAHQAYEGVRIERSMLFAGGRYFLVADRLEDEGRGEATFQWRLHGWAGYGAGGTFTLGPEGATWARERAGIDVLLASTAGPLSIEEPPYTPGEVPHVDLFDLERTESDHGVMDGVVQATAPGFLAVLAPWRQGAGASDPDGPLAVEALDAGPGVAAFRIEGVGFTDLAVLREPGAPEVLDLGGTGIETDGELAWVRISGTSALLARGTRLAVDGVQRISTSEAVDTVP